MLSVRIKLACTLLLGVLVLTPFLATPVRATDDTARFNGAWEISFPHNGQMLTLVSVHDASGFKNYLLLPDGSMPVGNGKFSAADGKYTATANKPNDSGTYQFTDNNTVVCTNAAGQTVTWKRRNAPLPSVVGVGAAYPTHVSASMNGVLAAAGKSWMNDAVISNVELQWYPPNVPDSAKAYWLKFQIDSFDSRPVLGGCRRPQ